MKTHLAGFLFVLAPIPSLASPIILDGNNSFVGYYSWVSSTQFSENAISGTGYRFTLNRRLGHLTWIDGNFVQFWFATSNCTGQAYALLDAGLPGYVSSADNAQPTPSFYVPQDAVSQVLALGSYLNSAGACVQESHTPTGVYPAFPNDPETTGVQTTWPVPLRVTSSLLFRDGFESANALYRKNSWALEGRNLTMRSSRARNRLFA